MGEVGTEAPVEVALGSGDAVVCFSDGICEAMAPDGKMLGVDAVVRVVAESGDGSAESIAGAIRTRVLSHLAGGAASDDCTVLVVKLA